MWHNGEAFNGHIKLISVQAVDTDTPEQTEEATSRQIKLTSGLETYVSWKNDCELCWNFFERGRYLLYRTKTWRFHYRNGSHCNSVLLQVRVLTADFVGRNATSEIGNMATEDVGNEMKDS